MTTTPPRAPGRPRSAEADAAIARATLELLVTEGFRGLSVEAVRVRAGVGKATIYRRFPDKEALVRAAVEHLHAGIEPPDTGSVRDDVLGVFRLAYDAAVDRRAATFIPRLLGESAGDPELHAIFRAALIDPRRDAMREILRRGVERRELRADLDLELAIDLLAGPVIYRILIDGGDVAFAMEHVERVLDTALAGMARA